MQKRGMRSREALLQRLEGELDSLFDFIHQVFADNTVAIEVLQAVLRKATRRSKQERYERYLRLWAFRITVETIRRVYPKYMGEQMTGQKTSFEYLALEEKLALFLFDRAGLNQEEVASVLQIPVGRVGSSLTYAREKVAQKEFGWSPADMLSLRERVNFQMGLCSASTLESDYAQSMAEARQWVAKLPTRYFSEIESSIRTTQLLPLLSRTESVRWKDISWQYKLGLEASMLGMVGLLAVVVLPWLFTQVNADAFVEGRFADVFEHSEPMAEAPVLEEITADRLLASSEAAVDEDGGVAETDEFAGMEFPSGDTYETGSAPLAPSRQAAAVYRLIVQSPSPQDLIPQVRSLFAQKNVRERESSGRVMPGGVYFDGITSLGAYPELLKDIQKLGQTKTYSHPGQNRNPNERARVIVWVQQI